MRIAMTANRPGVATTAILAGARLLASCSLATSTSSPTSKPVVTFAGQPGAAPTAFCPCRAAPS